jgi:hypothetical protein
LGALLLAGLAAMALQAPLSVDIRERGDPTSLVALRAGIAFLATNVVFVGLTIVVKRRLKKGATEIQLTAAALALMAVFLGSAVLSFRFVFGTWIVDFRWPIR